MTAFQMYVENFKFAANAKVTKLLKSDKASDIEVAAACKTTKAYKESLGLRAKVDEVLAKPAEKQPEPAQKQDPRMGESRRW